ncbi:MAG: secretion system X translation initiation factor, partial [Ramlibacter sp.]|nr:secretion system X translation initiation factor [Ramlibacter sp.]
VAPAPPPVAPPLPFTAVGAIEGAHVAEGRPVAFVKQQEQLLLVRAGDTIGQTYRVEAVTSQKIEFIYLPLMQRQTLALSP